MRWYGVISPPGVWCLPAVAQWFFFGLNCQVHAGPGPVRGSVVWQPGVWCLHAVTYWIFLWLNWQVHSVTGRVRGSVIWWPSVWCLPAVAHWFCVWLSGTCCSWTSTRQCRLVTQCLVPTCCCPCSSVRAACCAALCGRRGPTCCVPWLCLSERWESVLAESVW